MISGYRVYPAGHVGSDGGDGEHVSTTGKYLGFIVQGLGFGG